MHRGRLAIRLLSTWLLPVRKCQCVSATDRRQRPAIKAMAGRPAADDSDWLILISDLTVRYHSVSLRPRRDSEGHATLVPADWAVSGLCGRGPGRPARSPLYNWKLECSPLRVVAGLRMEIAPFASRVGPPFPFSTGATTAASVGAWCAAIAARTREGHWFKRKQSLAFAPFATTPSHTLTK